MKESKNRVLLSIAIFIISAIFITIFSACVNNSADSANLEDGEHKNTIGSEDISEKKPALEWGLYPTVFEQHSADDGVKLGRIAYSADTNEFDIDDVSLILYYGGLIAKDFESWDNEYYLEYIENERKNFCSYPQFDVVCQAEFLQSQKSEKFLIRRVNENFVSKEYALTEIVDESSTIVEHKFSHSERIIIPKEIFQEEKGKIVLWVEGFNEVSSKFEQILDEIKIDYEKSGEKVTLKPVFI